MEGLRPRAYGGMRCIRWKRACTPASTAFGSMRSKQAPGHSTNGLFARDRTFSFSKRHAPSCWPLAPYPRVRKLNFKLSNQCDAPLYIYCHRYRPWNRWCQTQFTPGLGSAAGNAYFHLSALFPPALVGPRGSAMLPPFLLADTGTCAAAICPTLTLRTPCTNAIPHACGAFRGKRHIRCALTLFSRTLLCGTVCGTAHVW